jgi:hypothetical protein
MMEQNNEKLGELLRKAMAPVEGLKRDLWPRMLERLDEPAIQASWFDWALLALLLVWALVFPEVISGLLYHL